MHCSLRLAQKAVRDPKTAGKYVYGEGLDLYRDLSVFLNSRVNIGTNIFQKNWDMLIILDTCTPQGLRRGASEYDFIEDVGSYWSVGGHSAEWMANTFDRKYSDVISNTAYISSNPHTETVFENRLDESWIGGFEDEIYRLRKYGKWDHIEKETFAHIENLFNYTGKDGYTRPSIVTDRAIQISRNNSPEKMILHYMPPHPPYLDDVISDSSPLQNYNKPAFHYLKTKGDLETVFSAYLEMIRWVLNEVEKLLENVDYDTVAITADHGEAFGKYGIYKHHTGSLHPDIRKVPWALTTASDTGSYEPSFDLDESADRGFEETLEALGYI